MEGFSVAFVLEFGVFFGGILALAGWELYRTHKVADERKAKEAAEREAASVDTADDGV